MFSLTSFLFCTAPIDELNCFSTRETPHEDLRHRSCCGQQQNRRGHRDIGASSKGERALNKFLTEHKWNEDQLNKERLELLQQADDTFTHKTGDYIPNAGRFYDHAIHSYIWGQKALSS